jgi:hypothetical protein
VDPPPGGPPIRRSARAGHRDTDRCPRRHRPHLRVRLLARTHGPRGIPARRGQHARPHRSRHPAGLHRAPGPTRSANASRQEDVAWCATAFGTVACRRRRSGSAAYTLRDLAADAAARPRRRSAAYRTPRGVGVSGLVVPPWLRLARVAGVTGVLTIAPYRRPWPGGRLA